MNVPAELHLLDELIGQQRERLLRVAQRIVPHVILDDLFQPNDFPLLESHPEFRYEEGVVEGLLTARAALLAHWSEEKSGVLAKESGLR